MSGLLAVTIFVAGILISIMIHEWGHFATARRFGMRADRFFAGFGPTVWSIQRGETEFGFKAFPIGGFVRIVGMSPTDLRQRPVPDEAFDPDLVAEERRDYAQAHGIGLSEAPGIPPATWQRLDALLDSRGTPLPLRTTLIDTTRSDLGLGHFERGGVAEPEFGASDPAPPHHHGSPDQDRADSGASVATAVAPTEARARLDQAIRIHVADSERIGDLNHRLLKGDEGRFFHDRPGWQRAIVLASGSFMHFVQAIALLFIALLLMGNVVSRPVIDMVLPDSPAAEVGLQSGDRILAIDGQPTGDDFAASRARIEASAGSALTVEIEREGEQQTLTATPQAAPDTGVGRLGFTLQVENTGISPLQAVADTFVGETSFPRLFTATVGTLGNVFGPEGIGKIVGEVSGSEVRSVESPTSVVGISRLAYDEADALGFAGLFFILASLNIFIGILNLVPLPPLDGGHLAVQGIEGAVNGVRGRMGRSRDFSVEPSMIAAVAVPVIVIFGMLFFTLLWLDIVNPIRL